ncbi:MAG TPA: hypothetical protein VFZ61_34365, partial [Polyangiales bacterium]
MPRASCRPDPVELLLRQVLQRSLLLAGATALVACSTALEVEDLDANDRQQPSGEADGQGPGVGPAGNGPQTPGPATGGPRDASASSDAGSTLDAAVEPVLRDAAIVRPSDAGPDVHAPPPPPGALGPALSCAPGMQLPIQASGIKPAQSFDYLAIRRRNGVFTAPVDAGVPTETWSETNFQVISETGARCASAPASACADKVAHHPQEFVRTGCVQVCWEISVVTTRGADVKRWAGVPELMNLLGSVDSADDALLLVEAAGYSLTCGKAEWTSWRSVPEGY